VILADGILGQEYTCIAIYMYIIRITHVSVYETIKNFG